LVIYAQVVFYYSPKSADTPESWIDAVDPGNDTSHWGMGVTVFSNAGPGPKRSARFDGGVWGRRKGFLLGVGAR
ncbi:MAG: hypothetical protein O7F76_04775, partial [Planctomycetota bacterium]|nr:hypothetical protein [Planctomycetota bacterium]